MSGYRVSGTANGTYIVSPSIVWCDGQLLRLPGQSAVMLPAQLQAGNEVNDPAQIRSYQYSSSLAYMSARCPPCWCPRARPLPANFCPTTPRGRGAEPTSSGQRRGCWSKYKMWPRGYTAVHCNATGKGLPAPPAWAWTLANGQNGTDDVRGLFRLGQNSGRGYTPTLGFTPLQMVSDHMGE